MNCFEDYPLMIGPVPLRNTAPDLKQDDETTSHVTKPRMVPSIICAQLVG